MLDMPDLRAKTASGIVGEDPSRDELWALIDNVPFDASMDFLILERSSLDYIQTWQEDAERFVVEYCAGSVEARFGTLAWSVDEVHEIFLAWTQGGSDWPTNHVWERLTL